jgi:DNA invertase Pin-like site-specific DNA recombinase
MLLKRILALMRVHTKKKEMILIKILQELLKKLIKKEKVAVCFDKVDRLSRSVFDKRVAYL